MSADPTLALLTYSHDNAPTLSLRPYRSAGATVVKVAGDVDPDSAPLLVDLADGVAGDRPGRVVLDLARVSFFCAAGISALLRVCGTIATAGGELVLRGPSPKVRLVFALTGASKLFRFDTADPTWHLTASTADRSRVDREPAVSLAAADAGTRTGSQNRGAEQGPAREPLT